MFTEYKDTESYVLPESAIRWLKAEMDGACHFDIDDLFAHTDSAPEFYTNSQDLCYREGFAEGVSYVLDMWAEGVKKPSPLWQRLATWFDMVIMPWRYWGEGKMKNYRDHHPSFSCVNLMSYVDCLPVTVVLNNGEVTQVADYDPALGSHCFSESGGFATWNKEGHWRKCEGATKEHDIAFVVPKFGKKKDAVCANGDEECNIE